MAVIAMPAPAIIMAATPIRPAAVIIMRTSVVAVMITRWRHRTTWRMAFVPPAMIAPAITIPVIAARAACTIVVTTVTIPPAWVTPVIAVPVITPPVAITDIDRKARRIQAEAAGLHGGYRRREQGKEQCGKKYRL